MKEVGGENLGMFTATLRRPDPPVSISVKGVFSMNGIRLGFLGLILICWRDIPGSGAFHRYCTGCIPCMDGGSDSCSDAGQPERL